jgi:hypothetical protein
MCLVIGLMQGFLVNPIVNNLSNYLDSDTLSAIQEYDEDQDIWAVANSSFMVENLPFSVGAATINSTNTYPNLELWHLLDSDNEYSDVYNRYAHIKINTIDTMSSEALFELDAPDAFTVNLDAEGLKKIGVTKLFSQDGSLENLSTSDVMVQKIWSNDSLYIYSVG